MKLLALSLALALAGCGVPVAVWTAGLGAGTAALTFDTTLLQTLHPSTAQRAPGAPSPVITNAGS